MNMETEKNNPTELWSRRLKATIFVLMTILIIILAFKLYKERAKTKIIFKQENPAAIHPPAPASSVVETKPQQENVNREKTRIYKCVSGGNTVYSESPCDTK